MFNAKNREQLIIVCTKETQKYGKYLVQLIGSKDDSDGRIVGFEDGMVEAVVWTEKDFEDNRPTLSSATRVLFIGSSKSIMEEKENMDEKFDKCGMSFFSLGKRAVMHIKERHFSAKQYKEFLSFAKDYEKQFEDLKMKKTTNTAIFGVSLFVPLIAGIPMLIYSTVSMKKNNAKIVDQVFSFFI